MARNFLLLNCCNVYNGLHIKLKISSLMVHAKSSEVTNGRMYKQQFVSILTNLKNKIYVLESVFGKLSSELFLVYVAAFNRICNLATYDQLHIKWLRQRNRSIRSGKKITKFNLFRKIYIQKF